MISKETNRLNEMQIEISDICDDIHNILNKDFKLLCNILVKYEPSFDEAKLCIILVYKNRHIAEYVYILRDNKIGARFANFNTIDTNGEKYNPVAIVEAFERDMRDKLNADVFLVALNHKK